MKSIKLSIVALATVLSFGIASAQTGLGIQAGYSMHQSTQKDSKALNGFHVGPTYELGIQGPISLQYGLLYNFATYKSSGSVTLPFGLGTITGSSSNTVHSLDIPVRLAATFPLSSGISAFVFGGPNFNIGLADNITTTVNNSSSTNNLYEKNKDYSRFDLQLGLGAGLKYNNMGVRVSYDFGMLNRVKDSNPAYKFNDLKVGLFYNF